MKKRTFISLALLILPVPPVSAEPADIKLIGAVVLDLAGAAGEVFAKFKGQPGEEFAYQVASASSRLAEQLSIVQVSQLFVEMVRYDAALLQRAAEEPILETALSILRTAYDDVKLKLDYLLLPANMNASSDFDGEISVVVDTQQKGKPVNGLGIRFYMRGQPDDTMPFQIFNDPTTPTSAKVPPGLYIAHVLNVNQTPRFTREVSIDGQGDEVRIVIEIP